MKIRISRQEPPDAYHWKPWFAWRPVIVGDHLVWLETVERKLATLWGHFVTAYDYQPLGTHARDQLDRKRRTQPAHSAEIF